MSAADRWRQVLMALVEERIGLRLQRAHDGDTLHRFVAARADYLGFVDPEAYVAHLVQTMGESPEFLELVAVVTNGQTSFFRDFAQLETIADLICNLGRRRGRTIKIWSAGCSTGEEPYSLAVLCAERGTRVQIHATDVNTEALSIAKAAHYSRWALRHVPGVYLARYFLQVDSGYQVAPSIRRAVKIYSHNLVSFTQSPVASSYDVVVCRNVFLYFAPPRVEEVVNRFCRVLQGHGTLFLSASEALHGLDVPLSAVDVGGRIAYRKEPMPDTPRPAPAPPASPQSETGSYAVASELIEAGRFPEARLVLERLVQQEPEHVLAQVTLGNVFLRSHEFEAALTRYATARELEPLDPEVHYLQGLVYRKLGDLERARHALRRALFLRPQHWPSSFALAGVYERLRQPHLQKRELSRTLESIEYSASELFRSCTRGIDEIDIPLRTVRALCVRGTNGRPAHEPT